MISALTSSNRTATKVFIASMAITMLGGACMITSFALLAIKNSLALTYTKIASATAGGVIGGIGFIGSAITASHLDFLKNRPTVGE